MRWSSDTSKDSRPGHHRFPSAPVRAAAVAVCLAGLTASAMAHPVTLHMAFISEADDGLTRQSVDALARPEIMAHMPGPSAYGVEPSASHHAAVRRHRHRASRETAHIAATSDTSAPGPKADRPWVMVKLIAFTNWWNGWSERTLHTAALDVHLDRPVHHDQKPS